MGELQAANWVPEERAERPSIIVLPIPRGAEVDRYIDLKGYFNADVKGDGRGSGAYPRSEYYANVFRFTDIAHSDLDEEVSNRGKANTVCIQGHTEWFNSHNTVQTSGVILNRGHLGQNIYAGCRETLEQQVDVLKDMQYER